MGRGKGSKNKKRGNKRPPQQPTRKGTCPKPKDGQSVLEVQVTTALVEGRRRQPSTSSNPSNSGGGTGAGGAAEGNNSAGAQAAPGTTASGSKDVPPGFEESLAEFSQSISVWGMGVMLGCAGTPGRKRIPLFRKKAAAAAPGMNPGSSGKNPQSKNEGTEEKDPTPEKTPGPDDYVNCTSTIMEYIRKRMDQKGHQETHPLASRSTRKGVCLCDGPVCENAENKPSSSTGITKDEDEESVEGCAVMDPTREKMLKANADISSAVTEVEPLPEVKTRDSATPIKAVPAARKRKDSIKTGKGNEENDEKDDDRSTVDTAGTEENESVAATEGSHKCCGVRMPCEHCRKNRCSNCLIPFRKGDKVITRIPTQQKTFNDTTSVPLEVAYICIFDPDSPYMKWRREEIFKASMPDYMKKFLDGYSDNEDDNNEGSNEEKEEDASKDGDGIENSVKNDDGHENKKKSMSTSPEPKTTKQESSSAVAKPVSITDDAVTKAKAVAPSRDDGIKQFREEMKKLNEKLQRKLLIKENFTKERKAELLYTIYNDLTTVFKKSTHFSNFQEDENIRAWAKSLLDWMEADKIGQDQTLQRFYPKVKEIGQIVLSHGDDIKLEHFQLCKGCGQVLTMLFMVWGRLESGSLPATQYFSAVMYVFRTLKEAHKVIFGLIPEKSTKLLKTMNIYSKCHPKGCLGKLKKGSSRQEILKRDKRLMKLAVGNIFSFLREGYMRITNEIIKPVFGKGGIDYNEDTYNSYSE